MKTSNMTVIALAVCMLLCGSTNVSAQDTNKKNKTKSGVLDRILGTVTDGQTIGNALSSILGTDKPKADDIIGTWRYRQPGIAFTTQNTLAKAGGEAMATDIKDKLANTYAKIGFNEDNTQFTFEEDSTFSAKIDGKPLKGTWSYTEEDQKLTLKTRLLNIIYYAKKTTGGMSFLMESKKLLATLQAITALSKNKTIQGIGNLSKNYDGVRIGFDMTK